MNSPASESPVPARPKGNKKQQMNNTWREEGG